MRIFHDWEFLEDGETIEWISVGMRAEDGRELYLVNRDMPAHRIAGHPWLMANVVPHLPLHTLTSPGRFSLDKSMPFVVPKDVATARIENFILAADGRRADDDEPELWAWFGAYDHVRLAQMWGPMIALPFGVPMVTHDIATLRLLAGKGARACEPKPEPGSAHHALADARFNEKLHGYYLNAVLDKLEARNG